MIKVIKIIILFALTLSFINFSIVNAQVNNKINESQTFEVSGKIDSYVFSRSVPKQMKIGESYQINVYVKNTGKTPGMFRVVLTTPGEFIYPQYDSYVFKLKKGESHRVVFLITPIKPHIGSLNITVDLYLVQSHKFLPTDFVLLDRVYGEVRIIKPAFSIERAFMDVAIIIMVLVIFILTIIFVHRVKHHFHLK